MRTVPLSHTSLLRTSSLCPLAYPCYTLSAGLGPGVGCLLETDIGERPIRGNLIGPNVRRHASVGFPWPFVRNP